MLLGVVPLTRCHTFFSMLHDLIEPLQTIKITFLKDYFVAYWSSCRIRNACRVDVHWLCRHLIIVFEFVVLDCSCCLGNNREIGYAGPEVSISTAGGRYQ